MTGSMRDRHWVTVTLNSGTENEATVEHPPGYTLVPADRYRKLNDAMELLRDLDRSLAGRHRGDAESQDPTGVSRGNPLLPPGTHIGHDRGGRRILVPDVRDLGDAKAWIEGDEKEQER